MNGNFKTFFSAGGVDCEAVENSANVIASANRNKFESSIAIAKEIKKGVDFVMSDEGQTAYRNLGLAVPMNITGTETQKRTKAKRFVREHFDLRFKTSYFNRLHKLGKRITEDPQILSNYRRARTRQRRQGFDVSLSVDDFNKFVNSNNEETTNIEKVGRLMMTINNEKHYFTIESESGNITIKKGREIVDGSNVEILNNAIDLFKAHVDAVTETEILETINN